MKQVKKLLIMLLIFTAAVSMVSTVAFAADTSFEVQAVDVTATAGGEAVMTVQVNSNPGVVAAILNIKYDSNKLTLNSVTSVNFLNDEVATNIGSGECTVVLDNALADANVTNTGALLTLNFTVEDGAAGEITVDLTVKEAVNYDLETVTVSAVDGKVTVSGGEAEDPSMGDVTSKPAENVLPADNITFSGSTMTIAPAETTPACMVLIKNGDNYSKVAATKNEDGTYSFDMSTMPEGAKIVVAVKGDANGDGEVTLDDAVAATTAWVNNSAMGGAAEIVADVSGEEGITLDDAVAITTAWVNASGFAW